MSKLTWHTPGTKTYETGIRMGVLYPAVAGTYPEGHAWQGLTTVTEAPTGGETTGLYADDIKYLELVSLEEFAGTIECYSYPEAFNACNGIVELAGGLEVTQQSRQPFGMCYRTVLGNDEKKDDYAYILHLVYGASASVSQSSFSAINNSPTANTMSFAFTTTPVEIPGAKPSALLKLNSTKIDAEKLKAIEAMLYGADAGEGGTPAATTAKLPLPKEIIAILNT